MRFFRKIKKLVNRHLIYPYIYNCYKLDVRSAEILEDKEYKKYIEKVYKGFDF